MSIKKKNISAKRRLTSVRSKVKTAAKGTPRLTVFRSNKNIHAQIVCDVKGVTLFAASSKDKDLQAKAKKANKSEVARLVGKSVAEKAVKGKQKEVVFDRSGYLYHGRVKELAEGAREAGLKF